jgi:hypothetical protein
LGNESRILGKFTQNCRCWERIVDGKRYGERIRTFERMPKMVRTGVPVSSVSDAGRERSVLVGDRLEYNGRLQTKETDSW